MYNIQISKYPNIQISKYPKLSKKFLLILSTILLCTTAESVHAQTPSPGTCTCSGLAGWSNPSAAVVTAFKTSSGATNDCRGCIDKCYNADNFGSFRFDKTNTPGQTCYGYVSLVESGENYNRCAGCDWALSERHMTEHQRENSKNTHKN